MRMLKWSVGGSLRLPRFCPTRSAYLVLVCERQYSSQWCWRHACHCATSKRLKPQEERHSLKLGVKQSRTKHVRNRLQEVQPCYARSPFCSRGTAQEHVSTDE
ncbi:hypothetical protein NDU88_004796 [Pleurodeles waltl]|uniref:Secreted protein n=1 Tax=Pleurodeles waltl TaxID=8319 RepID=A0AAV7PKU3_PLEWA|nr:hypothetical protein NDU88_004796 [Pleurodeles waltl]